ncbi:AraC family transcriptional regulator [Streptomyces camponoticapitis]|uniref:AraC family transcriptional regulator n=1 Tax=Streptomyces camponoticapitis TaxID=1616125 RepID=A0ABQ2ETW0_9ACTN|nr:AraC family transcriptional regulator [Streptomyces camponoticapitis]GGK20412.1 AraC family transcriptional regulator [Streptomyces camponoticapitis]
MDPLSHVLSLLNVEGVVSVPLLAGGDWAVDFSSHRHVKFAAVLTGRCWLIVKGVDEPIRLQQGDCYLVIGDRRYRLSSNPDVPAVDAAPVFANLIDGLARCGTGHDTTLVGGRFTFDEANAALLLDGLPPVIHVPAGSDQSDAMRTVVNLIGGEALGSLMGSTLMLDRLAQVLLLQALRAHARSVSHDAPGWLAALLDPRVGPALNLMHSEPARPWTVANLAAAVNVSRSTFASRFKNAVGASPAEYLTRLRMHVAGAMLRDTDLSVASIATAVGYASESSFTTAFRRVMTRTPHVYRTRARQPDHPPGQHALPAAVVGALAPVVSTSRR